MLDFFTVTHVRKLFSLLCLTEIWLSKDVVDHEVRDGGVAIYIDDELSAVHDLILNMQP